MFLISLHFREMKYLQDICNFDYDCFDEDSAKKFVLMQ